MAAPIPTPPVLPISSQQNATETSNQSTFRAILNQLSETIRQRRPWPELADRTAFSKPLSFSEATLRARHNISYFRINYYLVISLILAVSLLTSPSSLFLLIFLLTSWLFLYLLRPSDQPLHLFGRTFSDFETLSILSGLTFALLFVTSLGSLLLNAFTLSVSLVAAHASFRVPEDLFLDEREASQPAGFLSILRAVAPSPHAVPVGVTPR